jgi:hypothetical protein
VVRTGKRGCEPICPAERFLKDCRFGGVAALTHAGDRQTIALRLHHFAG